MTAPGRLLVYSEATVRGGAEVSLRNLVRSLADGVEVTVAGPDAGTVGWLAEARPGARQLVLPPARGRGDVAGLLRHRAALRAARPDVVHVNLSWAGGCVVPLAAALSLRRTPVVAVEHLPLPVGSRAARLVKQQMSRRLAAHVGVGESAAREVERGNGLPPGSLRVVHNGVPDHPLPRIPRGEGAPVVGALARFDEQKGLDVLLRALVDLPDVRALLVGGGEQEDALRRLAADLGVADRVELRAWSADPRAVLAGLDVFVLPSRYEGFPLSVVEAMLAGVPVVATDVGSVGEAVRDRDTGYLVPAEDPVALAAGIWAALADPGRTAGPAGLLARRSYTDSVMAATYEQVYAEALGRPFGRGRVPAAPGPPTPHPAPSDTGSI